MEIIQKREKQEDGWVRPAVGLCNDCNSEVVLYGMTNACQCGLLYNLFGDQLRPQQYWEEDR